MKSVRCSIAIILLSVCLVSSTFAGGKELRVNVTNPSSFARSSETVSISLEFLDEKRMPAAEQLSVFEAGSGARVLSQVTANELLFQTDLAPNETKQFIVSLRAFPSKEPSHVDGRFMLPREDYAWENDRIAFRMYGPALAKEVSNGIDVWCKRVRHLIVEKWYKEEADTGAAKKSYHVDNGEGADFFSVGKSLGAGGLGIWVNGKLYQCGVFTSCKTIENGPIRVTFQLMYTRCNIGGYDFVETKRISLDAGQNLNRIEVRFSGVSYGDSVSVACGLVKREGVVLDHEERNRWLSLWGPTNKDSVNGFLGTGIVIPAASLPSLIEDKDHYLLVSSSDAESAFVYYAGAGWTRSGDFKNEQEWKDYLDAFARSLSEPLKIRFVK